jgi:hypothetical protein
VFHSWRLVLTLQSILRGAQDDELIAIAEVDAIDATYGLRGTIRPSVPFTTPRRPRHGNVRKRPMTFAL